MLRRPALPLFALVLGVYAYFYQAGGWNQNVRLDLTRAIVERGSFVIDDFHRNTGDEAKRGEHFYCDKAPGLSVLAVPAYAAWRALGGRDLDVAAYVTTLFSVAVPSAFGVLAFFWLLSLLGVEGPPRLGITLAYALGTMAFPFATLAYGHQPAAAALVAAFALAVDARRNGARAARTFAAGVLLGVAVAIEYPAALVGVVIVVYALFTVRPAPRLLWGAIGGAIPTAALAAYHAVAFGGPAVLPYVFSTQHYRSLGFFMGLGRPDLHAAAQILWSPYRGLVYSSPWLLLAIPGAVWLARDTRRRAEALACLASFALVLWMSASLIDSWHGGWTFGPRYLIPGVPFLAVLAAGVPTTGRAGRVLLSAGVFLTVVSIFLMVVAAAVKPEVPVWIKRPFPEFLFPAFHQGHLAINTQGIDMKGAPVGAAAQAWNLGQKLGLSGLASLLPLAVWVLGCAAWLATSRSSSYRSCSQCR